MRLNLGLVLAVLAFPSLARSAEPALFKIMTLDAALKAAALENKIVLIDFIEANCPPCKRMELTTWRAKSVVDLLRAKTIAIQVDGSSDKALVARFGINYYPTMILLAADGKVVDRLTAYKSPAQFVSEFTAALEGSTALKRARAAAAAAKKDPEKWPQARLDLAEALTESGHFKEALKEYVWLYDKGMKGNAYEGVRVSFLLDNMLTLGRRYPPALSALEERRDASEKRLRAANFNDDDADELCSLNDYLGEKERSLSTYEGLAAGTAARKRLGRCVNEQLIAAKRYADAVEARPFEEAKGLLQADAQLYWGPKSGLGLDDLRRMRAIAVEGNSQQIEAFAGAGKLDEAKELMRRLAALDDSPEARAVVQSHLERAGRSGLAR